jgi:uncharacterized integral membrane protein
MKRAIRLIILIPLGIVLVALALANRAPVTLSLDPFRPDAPVASVTVPLFVALLVTLLAGVAIGGIATWFGQGKWRRAARSRARELAALQREQLLRRQSPAPPASGTSLVTLPREERRAG